jgi:hypothetical protein
MKPLSDALHPIALSCAVLCACTTQAMQKAEPPAMADARESGPAGAPNPVGADADRTPDASGSPDIDGGSASSTTGDADNTFTACGDYWLCESPDGAASCAGASCTSIAAGAASCPSEDLRCGFGCLPNGLCTDAGWKRYAPPC